MSLSSSFTSESSELGQLRDENRLLRQELSQCKADKDFVWSLWQRLQVSNPDVTKAIAYVLERKKEETDAFEKKLCSVILERDAKIQELDQQTVSLNREVGNLLEGKLGLQNQLEQRQLELKNCLSKVALLQKELKDYELRDAESASREVVRELDALNLELKQELAAKDSELALLQSENSEFIKTEHLQRDRILNLEETNHSWKERNSVLNNELSVLEKKCQTYEDELHRLKKEIDSNYTEMGKLQRELSETWQTHRKESEFSGEQTKLNQQLLLLLKDTQKMMQTKEDAFTFEIESQKQTIAGQVSVINSLKDKLQDVENEFAKLIEERQVVEPLLNPLPKTEMKLMDEDNVETLTVNWQQKLDAAERKMTDLRQLLVMKNTELEALRTAHSRRLERLRSVLSSNRLMKKQLKLFHEDPVGHVSAVPVNLNPVLDTTVPKKRQKIPHKSFQKEDCDSVWNEFDQLKNEHRALKAENTRLVEEYDSLRIESANSATTIHELKCCLEQQQLETNLVKSEREKFKSDCKKFCEELSTSKSRIDKMKSELSVLLEERNQIRADLEIGDAENKALAGELDFFQHQDSQQKKRIALLEKDILRLHRKSRTKMIKQKTVKTQTSTQMQKAVKVSYQPHRPRDFERRDDWQDLSDGGTDRSFPSDYHTFSHESPSVVTGNSLEQVSIHQWKPNGSVSSDDVEQLEDHKRTVSGKPNPKKKSILTIRQRQAIKKYVLTVAKDLMRSNNFSEQSAVEKETSAVAGNDLLPTSASVSLPKASSSKKVASLKQRIASLLRQVDVLKMAKESALSVCERQKKDLELRQDQLNNANQRLQSCKLIAQKLTLEVDRLKAEKETLEAKMSEYTFDGSSCSGRPDQDWSSLQSRLKSSSSALSKQLEIVKQLRSDNQTQQEKISHLTQRNDRLELDLNSKRTLIEEYKLKLTIAEEDTDLDMMREVESKLKHLSEENFRLKTKVDCLAKRISVVSREKFNLHATIKKLSEEVDKKSKLVTDLQRKNADLQSGIAATEKSASSHLKRLATQTEAAVDVAQSRLSFAESRLQECSSFVKMLAHSLLEGLRHSRLLLKSHHTEVHRRKRAAEVLTNPSLTLTAQHRACEILNISETDLTDILSTSGYDDNDEEEENQKLSSADDARWAKKCELLLQSDGDFSAKLVHLFIEKVEERCNLTAQISVL